MISTHPDVKGSVNDALIQCIDQCFDCTQTCISCADACLAEPTVNELKQCIRLNLDCADVCETTARLASRRTGSNQDLLQQTLQLCANACRMCGAECQRHAARMEHCRICADACKACEQACQQAMSSVH